MPSSLQDSFGTGGYNPDTLAGAYAHRQIEQFVNTIRAASYPHTPEQTGGIVYELCNKHLQECMDFIGDDDPSNLSSEQKGYIRTKAIESLDNLVETLSSGFALSSAEQRYVDEFVFIKAVTDKIAAGENMDTIREFIQNAPIGDGDSPQPPEPE